jgi:uncharacterized protein YxjI
MGENQPIERGRFGGAKNKLGGERMKTFTVTQKILSLGATYLVTANGGKDPVYVIKGKILTLSPKLDMRKSEKGEVIKKMQGNLLGNKYTVLNSGGAVDGLIQFPLFSFIAKFTLTVGSETYKAKGGIMARNFSCVDASGGVKFVISKEWAFRDKFTVSVDESFPEETAILAAVSIDQRFFQNKS